ncbi:peptide ABC transporter substrate-binding protein [Weissella confusa]|nr:peptide ABC transporter substrate-binding protein [Weissella confusa]
MKKQMLVATTLSMLAISAGGMTNQVLAASKSDTFTYAISGDLESTNPIATSDRWGLTFDNIQYSPLFHVAEDGSYEPVLATSHDVSSDGKTITVNLRHGVKWSDGQPFTADDVVFTYQKLADKANGNSDNLYINNQPIQIEKVNDNQVKFVLPEKSVSAVNNIMTDTFIIPKHVYDKTTGFSGSSLTPGNVGTGPYTLESYKQGQEVRFVRNAHYFGGQPKMKHVVLRILTDPNTTNIALKKGEVDASFVLPTQLKSLKSAHLKVTAYSENRVGYMGLNTHVQKLSNVKVRQAIFYALDKHEMNQAAYLNKAYYNTPVSFLPPKDKYATTDVQMYKTNDNKAKQLLHEAGVKNLTLNLGYDSSDAAQKIADAAIVYPIVDNKKILVINKDVKGANEAKNLPIYTFADWSKLSK